MSMAIHRLGGTPARRAERRPVGRRARRLGVAIFFASVAVNAGLGIYAVLAPDFGETQGKILGTSLCVTGAVLVALACEPAWERKLLGLVPHSAAVLGVTGFTLAIALVWTEPESETWPNIMMTIFTFSVAGVAASLLALSRLAPRHGWVLMTTLALLAVGAAMYSAIPWLGEPGEWYARSFGVVMIVLAAFVVTVPVLHWVDRGALATQASTDAVRFCPHCGGEVAGYIGHGFSCERCGRGFTVLAAARESGESIVNLT